jgi:demethylspheroidene O-methyltransferase
LFDHDDSHASAILRAARAALPAGGTLLVAEPMARTAGAHTRAEAYFGIYLLAMGRGQSRSAEALSVLIRAAGFDEIRTLPTRQPLQAGLLVARAC